MENPSNWVTCDGCGFPASPAHIEERVSRLELATRFRPIHINVLFVAAAPLVRPEDDFYRPPDARKFFDSFMEGLEIAAPGNKPRPDLGADPLESDSARLVEFQHRGFYLSYLSECPIAENGDTVSKAISRLGSTLLRRIRFNYRPKHIAILGGKLSPLRDIFENAGMSAASLHVLEAPDKGDAFSITRFKAALASLAPVGSGAD